MKQSRRTLFVIFCAAGLLLSPPLEAAKKNKVDKDLYEELDLFAKALHYVRENYVEVPEDQDLLYGAIQGMLQSLDPHSVFMPKDIYRELQLDTTGRFGGVGIEVMVRDRRLTVVTPIEGSPAEAAGIRPGDFIVRINGRSTKNMSLGDAVKLMRGKRGSRIQLRMGRNGEGAYDVTLKREIIRIKSVHAGESLGDGLAYLRISAFQQDTANSLEKALNKLEDSPEGLKGLIIDLRNNPGGLLTEAIEVADKFLDEGVIVSTKSRSQLLHEQRASENGTHRDFPIMILVNGGSASAAEIVAGALQDHKRAVLIGEATFGKGSVQTVYEMGDGSAVKLTVAKYYTPKGRSIQSDGIKPDVVVAAKPREEEIKVTTELKDGEKKGDGKQTEESFTIEVDEDQQKQAAIKMLRKKVGIKHKG